MVIDDDVKIGNMSGGNCYVKNRTLFKQDCDYNNGDGSGGYGFLNSHSLSQCEGSSAFKYTDEILKRLMLLLDMVL